MVEPQQQEKVRNIQSVVNILFGFAYLLFGLLAAMQVRSFLSAQLALITKLFVVAVAGSAVIVACRGIAKIVLALLRGDKSFEAVPLSGLEPAMRLRLAVMMAAFLLIMFLFRVFVMK